MSRFDVLVVGGGMAGIAAALKLAAGGFRVGLLEARSRLGGRAGGALEGEAGSVMDGEHLLFGCCRAVLAVFAAVGGEGALQVERAWRLPFFGPAGRRGVLRVQPLPAPWHLVAAVLRARHLRPRGRWAVVRALRRLARGLPPSEETALSWWAREGQPQDAVSGFWQPLCLALMNAPPESASAPVLARALQEVFLGGRRASGLIRFRRPPAAVLARAAPVLRAKKGEVHLATPVQRLEIQAGRGVAVITPRGRLEARGFVLAVPWRGLARLLPPGTPLPPPPAAAGILTFHLELAAAPSLPGMVGLLEVFPHWLFDAPEGRPSYRQAVVSAADPWFGTEDDALLARLVRDLRRVLPAGAQLSVRRARVLRLRGATPLITPRIQLLPTTTPWPNVVLAGDMVATGLPATLEGAARSGFQAAARLAAAIRGGETRSARAASP